ncbi:MAG: thioredoxin family protein, partial [Planctomycetota bacterium]
MRVVPLAIAAAAVSLASAGPPADAGTDPQTAGAPADPGAAPSVCRAERTAAYAEGATGRPAGEVKLIWFTMTNCGPCQTIRPYVERMAAEGLPVFKVDLNRRPDIAQRFGVNSAPTFILQERGRETWRTAGVPGGDGFGVARRLRDRLARAMTADDARLARNARGAAPSASP